MSYRRTPFAPKEHYHCYTRGIDGRITFPNPEDYRRFQQSLYLCNDTKRFERTNYKFLSHDTIFTLPRDPIVGIGSYSLMPTHYHVEFEELVEGGASKFLQKLGTGYTGYYNEAFDRIGSLFIGPCRSKHVSNDRYLKQVTQYIHLNAAELYEPKWKEGVVKDMRGLEQKLAQYPYSSLRDYLGPLRPETSMLHPASMDLLKHDLPPLKNILEEAHEYYKGLDFS